MGRIKGKHLKTAAKELMAKYGDKFTADFEVNQAKITALGLLPDSKEERNKLAGEITNQVKRKHANDEDDAGGEEQQVAPAA